MRFFDGGWGDLERLEAFDVTSLPDPRLLSISWSRPRVTGTVAVQDGTFPTPVDGLPHRSRQGHVRRVEPAAGTDRVVVLMSAWNDHGYKTRTALAVRLAHRGVGTVIMENPFYGVRRPDPARDQPIHTVADFVAMGDGAIAEARSMLATLQSGARVGISGYSMGGNMAAIVGASMPFPVAIAPLAASHSPGPVYLDGVLRNGIRWDALGGEAHARSRLTKLMYRASALLMDAPAHTSRAVIVGARRDGFVPPRATKALHEHWPGSELRWIDAGHATLLWLHKDALADAISDSFDRLNGSDDWS
jgi:pimeloyl-ACP methyl ester carboxylesterase